MKRSVSLLLVLAMAISMMPLHAFAAQTNHHDHAQPASEPTENLYQELQSRTDALLLEDLGGTSMTDVQTRATVDAMDGAAVDDAAHIIDSTGSQEFVFTDAIAAEVYSTNKGTWSGYGRVFCMTITGIDSIQNLQAYAVMISGTNTEHISDPFAN